MDPLALFFYFLQQLGMTLGVGASTFAVMFYILGMADGRIDASERAFMRAVYTTLRIGLFLIVVSGAAITGAHLLVGDTAIIAVPAFLFKWILVGIITISGLLMSVHVLPRTLGGIIAGASWYALFIVHTLAVAATWPALITLYAMWLALFAGAFLGLARFAQHWHEEHYREPEAPAAPRTTPSPRIEFTLPSASAPGERQ